MPNFSQYSLQKSIYQLLSSDSALSVLVSGVYDFVPQASIYPYVVIGEDRLRDWSTKTTNGAEHQLTLHVHSREGGRKQAALIMERLHTLLHNAALTMTGQTLVAISFEGSDIMQEKDGIGYHGVMRYRALTEAA